MIHDCFGSILKTKGATRYFLCVECGRPYAVLTKAGMRISSRHGGKKDDNLIPMKALKRQIAEVERE